MDLQAIRERVEKEIDEATQMEFEKVLGDLIKHKQIHEARLKQTQLDIKQSEERIVAFIAAGIEEFAYEKRINQMYG